MAKVVWTDQALAQLEQALDFAAAMNPAAAASLGADILAAIERLELFPLSGRVVPERGDSSIRELIVQGYRVAYRVRGDVVELLAIQHGARGAPPA